VDIKAVAVAVRPAILVLQPPMAAVAL
jgi:hypothetical protein